MTVRITGPLYDGRALAAVDAYTRQIEHDIAVAGQKMVLDRLAQVLQHPTGHYQSLIRTDRVSNGERISDGGKVVYGPWLEGIGSRNYPKTIFRGYRTFRLIGQQLRMDVWRVAEITLPPFLARME